MERRITGCGCADACVRARSVRGGARKRKPSRNSCNRPMPPTLPLPPTPRPQHNNPEEDEEVKAEGAEIGAEGDLAPPAPAQRLLSPSSDCLQ